MVIIIVLNIYIIHKMKVNMIYYGKKCIVLVKHKLINLIMVVIYIKMVKQQLIQHLVDINGQEQLVFSHKMKHNIIFGIFLVV